jgi:pSer/pThr/pTyr-binding forkhead associated (FHA) protein
LTNRRKGEELEMPDELVTRLVTQARENAQSAALRTTPQLPGQKRVSLLATAGPVKGASFPILKPQVLIGRTEGDIVVNDPKVSRNHCVVEIHGSYGLLVDLDSANGTFVEDRKAATAELRHLTEFRIGSTTLMFTITGGEQA